MLWCIVLKFLERFVFYEENHEIKNMKKNIWKGKGNINEKRNMLLKDV